MKVLVTGGAGFIGSHLADALLMRGDSVIVLDNFKRGHRAFLPPDCEVVEGDIREASVVEQAVRGVEVVYHLAAQSNVMGAMDDIDYSHSTNVAGTLNVLRAAAGAGVRRLVFSSSREVYGDAATTPVNEDAPLAVKNVYGASKVAGEAYCRAWATVSPLEIQVLRLANVYGPRDTGRVIPLWASRALRGEPLEVYGGEQVLDFVDVHVTIGSLLAASDAPLAPPINIGSGQGTRLLDLADRVLSAADSRSQIHIFPQRKAEVVRFVADTTRMRDLLGIRPPADSLCRLDDVVASLGRVGWARAGR